VSSSAGWIPYPAVSSTGASVTSASTSRWPDHSAYSPWKAGP
jgi:hypothetical protein